MFIEITRNINIFLSNNKTIHLGFMRIVFVSDSDSIFLEVLVHYMCQPGQISRPSGSAVLPLQPVSLSV